MDHWFSIVPAGSELPPNTVEELDYIGFVVIPGPLAQPHLRGSQPATMRRS